MIAATIMVVFPFAMIYSAFSDIFTMTIANRVSLVLIGTFLLIAPFIGLTWHDFAMHWVAFATVLAVTFGLFALGVMGGGDAKLMASTSLWIGFSGVLAEYLIYSTLVGGVVTVALMAFRHSSFSLVAGEVPALRKLVHEIDVPYGIALAAGGLMAFPASPPMLWALAQFAQ